MHAARVLVSGWVRLVALNKHLVDLSDVSDRWFLANSLSLTRIDGMRLGERAEAPKPALKRERETRPEEEIRRD